MAFILKSVFTLSICLSVSCIASAQFLDEFNSGQLQKDPTGAKGWTFFTGDGTATMDFLEKDGAGIVSVDATTDKQNIWWALIKRQVSPYLNLKRLSKPEYELRVEARVKVSHAPRRLNLSVNSQRTTDFHSDLMEFYIDDTSSWHTISFTAHNFNASPGDTVYAQLALMDWGLGQYQVKIDYFKVEVVNPKKAEPDKGILTPYRPPIPPISSFTEHLEVEQDATLDLQFPELNFNNWSALEKDERKILLNVNTSQYGILRWNLEELEGKKVSGAGLLEITTYSLQNNPDYKKDFGMVRVVEILGGKPDWDEKEITVENFLQGASMEEVFNPQMIIDVPIQAGEGGKNFITIPQHVLQRMLDGKTHGIVIKPLGAVNASFFAHENQDPGLAPKLHLNVAREME